MSASELDAALARLTSDKAAREGLVAEDDEEGWMRARNRRDASGSYLELERALEMLDEHHRRALHVVYDYEIPYRGSGISTLEAHAVRRLATLMPAKIKVPRSLKGPILDLQKQIIKSVASWRMGDICRYTGAHKKLIREVLQGR